MTPFSKICLELSLNNTGVYIQIFFIIIFFLTDVTGWKLALIKIYLQVSRDKRINIVARFLWYLRMGTYFIL